MPEGLYFNGTVDYENADDVFEDFDIETSEDLERYERLIEKGEDTEVLDEFIGDYIRESCGKYQGEMIKYLVMAQEGEMTKADRNKVRKNIILLSAAFGILMTKNFEAFAGPWGAKIFAEQGIKSANVQQAILESTVGQFEDLTRGSMVETEKFILSSIRKIQTEMITENQKISQNKYIGDILDTEIDNFKNKLKTTMPDYYTAIKEGKILKSRRFGEDGEKVIKYRLDDYAEMATRTTLLNVDRTAVEFTAGIDEIDVVEYYLRDDRPLKTGKEREICQEILGTDILGKPILAMDGDTAGLIGIMTLDDAKAQGAMGPHCRHSIRIPSNRYLKRLAKEYNAEVADEEALAATDENMDEDAGDEE